MLEASSKGVSVCYSGDMVLLSFLPDERNFSRPDATSVLSVRFDGIPTVFDGINLFKYVVKTSKWTTCLVTNSVTPCIMLQINQNVPTYSHLPVWASLVRGFASRV